MSVTETELILEAATDALGSEARPTSRLRLLACFGDGRLQQMWEGSYGTAWYDVPNVEVSALAPRRGAAKGDRP